MILPKSERQKKGSRSTSAARGAKAGAKSKTRVVVKKSNRRSRESKTSSHQTTSNQTSGDSENQKKRQKPQKMQKSSEQPQRDSREDWKEAKQEEAFDDDTVIKKDSQVMVSKVQPEPPKNVHLKKGKIDDEIVRKLLSRLKEHQKNQRVSQKPLDPKSKLLMDRMYKKPYPQKYAATDKGGLMLYDEASSFYRPSGVGKKPSGSVIIQEDSYGHYPRLAGIRKLPEQNVFGANGAPFWADQIEPDEAEMAEADCYIVGSVDVERYFNKEVILKTCDDVRVLLDVWQPTGDLSKRDDVHFNVDSLYANTLRSLLNVGTKTEEPARSALVASSTPRKVRFSAAAANTFSYSRDDPINSARAAHNGTTTTTTTTTVSAE